jgi:uncharacterized membrane protein YraQ (UPF0718 family)
MADLSLNKAPSPHPWTAAVAAARRFDPVLAALALGFAGLALAVPNQAVDSLKFLGSSLSSISLSLATAVGLAAAAKATGADALVAHAFVGRETRMIVLAALFGALSPFCSCGVIPVIAGLLAAGVPLAPVMAFWIASPLMDPNQFALLVGALGLEFALAKTAAAIGMGLLGGFVTQALASTGLVDDALRQAPKSACAVKAAQRTLRPAEPQWRFWRHPERAQAFLIAGTSTGWFLLRWLSVAFFLESLMVAYVPGDTIAKALGDGALAIPIAVAVGVPAYLNGFAAIPLMQGLIGLGMSKAVALAFMVAGGVTSIPAALAVWALVKPRVFGLYLAIAASGSLASGYLYLAYLAL